MDVATREQAGDSPVPTEEELQIIHVVSDTPAPGDCQKRAFKTIPEGLSIRPAEANNAIGVWATKDFEKGTRFGPFCGVQVDGTTGQESSCAWEIREDNGRGAVMHWIDAQDENKCNWMRYVNWGAEESKQNMKVYQEDQDIYFLTTCQIQAGSQLLSSDPRNREREPRSTDVSNESRDKDDADSTEGREDEVCDVKILDDDSEVDEAVSDADFDSAANTDDGSWVSREQKLPAQSGEGQLLKRHLQSQECGELCNSAETYQQHISESCGKRFEGTSNRLPSGSDHDTSVLESTRGAHNIHDDSGQKKDHVTADEESFSEDPEQLEEKEKSPNVTEEEEKMKTENKAPASACHGKLFEKFAPPVDENLPTEQLGSRDVLSETKSDDAEMCEGNETSVTECSVADDEDISLQSAAYVIPDESHSRDVIDIDQHVVPITHMQPQEDAKVGGNAFESGIDSDVDVVGAKEHSGLCAQNTDDRASPVLDKCDIDDGMSQQVWRQLICNICRKACHNKQAFEEHQKTHISQCKICHISFRDEESLAQHMRDHKERPFFCGTCGKSYKTQLSLKEHEYSHTGYRPFVCPFCPKGFMRNKRMKLHIKKAHRKLIHAAQKPPLPPIMPMQDSELMIGEEVDSNTLNTSLQYRDCGYSVTKKSLLLEHTRNECSKRKANCDPYEAPMTKACPVCCSSFSSSTMLCIHLHGHVYDKLLKCSQCPLRFSLHDELEKHEKDHPDYNQMLLKLISADLNRKLNDQGDNRAKTAQVKIEPGLEKSISLERSNDSSRIHVDTDHMTTRIKPEPVDQPEYSYNLGSLKDSSLGDYHSTQQTEIFSEAQSISHQNETDDVSIPTTATLYLQVQEMELQLKSDAIHPKQEQQEMPQHKLFRCRYCPSAFRLKGLCMAHERTVHRKVYSQRSEYQSKPVKDLSKMSVCKICNAVFEQQSSLSRHMLFKHGITMKVKSKSNTSTVSSRQLFGDEVQPPVAPEIQSGISTSHLSDDFGSSGLHITNVTSHANEQTVPQSETRPSLLKQRLESPFIFSGSTVTSIQGEVIQEPQPNPTYHHISRLESLLTAKQTLALQSFYATRRRLPFCR